MLGKEADRFSSFFLSLCLTHSGRRVFAGGGDGARGPRDGRVAAAARRRVLGRGRVRGGPTGAGSGPSCAARHRLPAHTAPGQVSIHRQFKRRKIEVCVEI